MNVQVLGKAPESLTALEDAEIKLFPESVMLPLFEVDAALFFPGADPDKVRGRRRAGAMKLIQRSGRPVLDFSKGIFKPDLLTDYLDHLRSAPRTNYQPVDCNFYDNFEAAIVQRRAVELSYLSAEGAQIVVSTLLKDLKTSQTEEFVQLASGEWLRLDRIVAVDGVAAGNSCTF